MILLLVVPLIISSANCLTRPTLDQKIIGGFDVTIEQYPYQASIQFLDSHICGGAVVSPNFILTAAHCVSGATPYFIKVRVGSSTNGYGGQLITVQSVYTHPNYNHRNVDSDMALLRLVTPIEFGASVQAVTLPYSDYTNQVGTYGIVSGWGYEQENGAVSYFLKAVYLPIVNKEQCRESYNRYEITENMFCAGVLDVGQKDTCQGDSGGPFVYDGKIVGIVSWGYGCARPKYPGVYTNVARLRYFIDSIIGY